MLSQVLMVIALAVLAYMVCITMNGTEVFSTCKKTNPQTERRVAPTERRVAPTERRVAPPMTRTPPQMDNQENFESGQLRAKLLKENNTGELINDNNTISTNSIPEPTAPSSQLFSDIPRQKQMTFPSVSLDDKTPFNNSSTSEINYASVPDTFIGSQSNGETVEDVNDVYKVDGTDLLAAPLADRFNYTNSIANVNRNASNDLRGDISLPYNDKFTPFNQSSIYGEPLTVNRL